MLSRWQKMLQPGKASADSQECPPNMLATLKLQNWSINPHMVAELFLLQTHLKQESVRWKGMIAPWKLQIMNLWQFLLFHTFEPAQKTWKSWIFMIFTDLHGQMLFTRPNGSFSWPNDDFHGQTGVVSLSLAGLQQPRASFYTSTLCFHGQTYFKKPNGHSAFDLFLPGQMVP